MKESKSCAKFGFAKYVITSILSSCVLFLVLLVYYYCYQCCFHQKCIICYSGLQGASSEIYIYIYNVYVHCVVSNVSKCSNNINIDKIINMNVYFEQLNGFYIILQCNHFSLYFAAFAFYIFRSINYDYNICIL
jgi:hypothetical protein